MQSQPTYFVWLCKPIWPLFEIGSQFFGAVYFAIIVTCAIYNQICVLYLVLLAVFAIMACKIAMIRVNYSEEKRFKDNELTNRKTRSYVQEFETEIEGM